MDSVFKVTHPNDVDFTLEVTMPLGGWLRLQKLLLEHPMHYPGWDFNQQIYKMVKQAEKEIKQTSDMKTEAS